MESGSRFPDSIRTPCAGGSEGGSEGGSQSVGVGFRGGGRNRGPERTALRAGSQLPSRASRQYRGQVRRKAHGEGGRIRWRPSSIKVHAATAGQGGVGCSMSAR